MMQKVVIIGGGGFAREVLDVLEANDRYVQLVTPSGGFGKVSELTHVGATFTATGSFGYTAGTPRLMLQLSGGGMNPSP